jgi:hypothetical protein
MNENAAIFIDLNQSAVAQPRQRPREFGPGLIRPA